MNIKINNIIETVIRNTKKQKLNILYSDTASSPVSSFLSKSDRLNFIKTNRIDQDIVDIGFSAYFCNDYLEIDKGHSNVINMLHIKNVIPFVDPPYRALKKEDFLILNQNLRLSKKICFNDFMHKVWNKYFEVDLIQPAVPDIELNDTEDRKSIIVISTSNKKQARLMHSQILKVINDVGLLVSFDNLSLEYIASILNQYKVAIVLDNSISCFLAKSSGCSVVCPIPFYEDVIAYSNSQELNRAIAEADKIFDSKRSIESAKKMKEDNSFENFDNELYNYIINITKEPFLL
jgi:hypothetical protein